MLVSHRKRFIYTKTMKTAGTSVEAYFERWCLPEGAWSPAHYRDESVTEAGIVGYRGPDPSGCRWFNHMPAAEIRRGVGEETWNSYFKFCVVRNPYDRLVSAFHFQERADAMADRGNDRPASGDGKADPSGVIQRFREWVRAGGTVPDLDTYVLDGRLCVDFAIRFEALLEDLETVCRRIGVPSEPESLPRLKAGYRPGGISLAEYYDPETEALVAERFRFDLEQLGYRSPLGRSPS